MVSGVRRETLLDFFHDFANARGDFLVYDNGYRSRTYSYVEVARAAEAFTVRLRAANVRKGDRVIFWSENRPEWVVAFWGCLLAGIVVVPIDYQASADFLHRVQQIVQPRVILIGDEISLPSFDKGTFVWRLADLEWSVGLSFDATDKRPDHTRDDVAEIIFTSGATAEPKGVVITHRNLLANIVPIEREAVKFRKYLRPFFPLRFLNLPPLSHLFGQAMAIFIPPMLLGTVVFMRGYNPYEIIRQIRKRRISIMVCVPKILHVLREYVVHLEPSVEKIPDRKRHIAWRWLGHWKIHRLFGLKFWSFVVGAAPLESELEEFWSRLGFLVIQGYGLTETAPVISFNHPFDTHRGSVGKIIPGVDVKIAPDGEILVRGETVTSGYYQAAAETAEALKDGWLHTGDIGAFDEQGRLYIRGRKKEMIVTPEGLNVFPEDVERVLNAIPGVRESAVMGVTTGGEERVHAVVVLERSSSESQSVIDPGDVMRLANGRLADHQKIRSLTAWPGDKLPRTEGTQKLKRREIKAQIERNISPYTVVTADDTIESIITKLVGTHPFTPGMTIEELGLSSLERVELLIELEERFQTSIDELAFAQARDVGDLRALIERSCSEPPVKPIDFPSWNRHWIVRVIRRLSLKTWILPLVRLFAWIRVEGREYLQSLNGPVIFAANHQSHMDTPIIFAALPPRWRNALAPAMAKEFFKAHFFPDQHTRWHWFIESLQYYLVTFFFNTFPLPQHEAGTRQTLHYIGELVDEGLSILIFPEGERTEGGEIKPFQAGVGLIASRLEVPVIPVRLEGVDRVLHHTWKMPRPGRVRVVFGPPLRLKGDDYSVLARQIEEAVKQL
jgi:long-chain acyl-CoA synthetase